MRDIIVLGLSDTGLSGKIINDLLELDEWPMFRIFHKIGLKYLDMDNMTKNDSGLWCISEYEAQKIINEEMTGFVDFKLYKMYAGMDAMDSQRTDNHNNRDKNEIESEESQPRRDDRSLSQIFGGQSNNNNTNASHAIEDLVPNLGIDDSIIVAETQEPNQPNIAVDNANIITETQPEPNNQAQPRIVNNNNNAINANLNIDNSNENHELKQEIANMSGNVSVSVDEFDWAGMTQQLGSSVPFATRFRVGNDSDNDTRMNLD